MALLHRRNPVAPALAIALLAVSGGCQDDGTPRVVTAQFADEDHDGSIQPGETIRLGLDRPLPDGFLDERPPVVELRSSASASAAGGSRSIASIDWSWRPSEQRASEIVLEATRVEGGTASLSIAESYEAADAMSLRVRFGREAGEWIDLTYLPSHPVLERVLWEDRSPNLAVDEGDVLRLVFDRPTRLRSSPTSRVRVPEDVRLGSDSDQLDDGSIRSRFELGDEPEEVLVVLGSRPRLTIAGSLESGEGDLALRPPSTIAVNGTRIFPSVRIVAAQGGWGAISTRALTIEFGYESPRWRPIGGGFPSPGHRIHHSVTPLPDGRALIVGGRAIDTDTATDQVLVFDPAALDRGKNPLRETPLRLPRPASEHTATLLAGPDGTPGTVDDLVVVIGGTDQDDQVLGGITLFAIGDDGEPRILKLSAELLVPRWGHRAVAVGALGILVDGGRTRGPSGLVGCAELLTFEVTGDGATIAAHVVFRSIPRIQHSLTALPASPGDARARYVLAYGGYGEYRLQTVFLARRDETLGTILARVDHLEEGEPRVDHLPRDVHFTDDDFGTVLVSPVLFDLDDPERSVVLKYAFSFPLLRRGHVAVALGERDLETTVLIAGGTSAHLEPVRRSKQRGWEIPGDTASFEGELSFRLVRNLPITPRGHEAGNAVLFRFDHHDPARSRFSTVPHPAPDDQMIERLHQAYAVVPGTGVLLVGGEQPEADGSRGLRIGDIFLEGRRDWQPLGPSLTQPRSGHRAFVLDSHELATVFVIGGRPDPAAVESGFSAIEELRLR